MIIDARTLADVIAKANASKLPIDNLVIVSHGNAEGTMYFGLGIGSPTMLQYETLLDDLAGTSVLPPANQKVLDEKTTVRIKGCNVGRSTRMLNLLDQAFGGKVTVTAPTHSQLFGKRVAAEALGEYFVSVPGQARLTEDRILQLFKDKYPWLREIEWRDLLPHMKEHVIQDPIPVNHVAIVPRNSSHTEAWFKTQSKWRDLQQQGYTSAIETKRTPVTGIKKIKIEITASGPDLTDRKLYYEFDERPSDAKLIADAEARHGLPGASEYKVELRAPDSLDLNVVARRTTWVIEGKPIKVDEKAVRGGRTQPDWHVSSTFAPPPP